MNDKMREEFEKFRDARNAILESEGHKPGSKWHVTNAHYPTWQASREAMVIELPPMPKAQRTDEEAIFSSGSCDMLRKCAKAIEAAGLKVKP